MSKTTISLTSLLCLTLVATAPCAATILQTEDSPYIISSLTPGKHAVGFDVIYEHNRAAVWGKYLLNTGQRAESRTPRPVQICLWYPAQPDTDSRTLTLRDYLQLDFHRSGIQPLTAEQESEKVSSWLSAMHSVTPAHEDLLEASLSMKTTSKLKAKWAEGSFPLVILIPDLNHSPWENAVLAEHLASHGFVVAATATKGEVEFGQRPVWPAPLSQKDAEAIATDTLFVKAVITELPQVEASTLLYGDRSAGPAALLAVLKDPEFEGLVLSGNPHSAASLSENYQIDVDRLRLPILFISGKTIARKPAEIPLQQEALYSDFYHLLVAGHESYKSFASSVIQLSLKTIRHDSLAGIPAVEHAYTESARAIKAFAECVRSGNDPEASILSVINDQLAELKAKQASVVPPTSEGMFNLLESDGLQAAKSLLENIIAENPDYQVFSPQEAYFEFIEQRNHGKYEACSAVASLAVEHHPDVALCQYLMGESFMLAGKNQLAIEQLQKVLTLQPAQNIQAWVTNLLKELGVRPENEGSIQEVPITMSTREWEKLPVWAQPYNDPGRYSRDRVVSGTVNQAEITIEYGAPKARGREILNELVSTHIPWRTGANEATVFTCSEDVYINGNLLPAGSYSLFSKGGEDQWTIIFNRVAQQWGAYSYDPIHDQLRVNVQTGRGSYKEEFTIILDETDTEALVTLAWGYYRVPFSVRSK